MVSDQKYVLLKQNLCLQINKNWNIWQEREVKKSQNVPYFALCKNVLGISRLAGIGAPKHGCRVSSEGSRRASALCKAPAVGGVRATVRPRAAVPRWLRARVSPPGRCRKKIRDVANCNFRHAAISPLRSNLDVWGCILRRRKVHYFNAFPGRR